MTNEEAIVYLERADTTVYKKIKTKTAEALEMAIKALEQTDKIEESNFSTEQYKADLQAAYDCGYAKALEQQPRWIPVTERLPEPNVAVLTYINTGATETYCLAYWNNMCEAWEEWIGIDLIEKDKGYKVIAWRELPEPY